MKLIKGATITEYAGSSEIIYRAYPTCSVAYQNEGMSGICKAVEVQREMVRAIKYRNGRGVDVYLAVDLAIQDALELREEAFENLQKGVDQQKKQIISMLQDVRDLKKLKELSLWNKIVWAFTSKP